jgi:putative hydrolase of the HAD superfamily
MVIEAVLFDADGVVQRTRGNWREVFATMLGRDDDLESFIADVFAAEKPCLTGAADFPTRLAAVLDRWNGAASLEQALSVWTNIEIHEDVFSKIASVRRAGMPCHLASNQQAFRARYMSDDLDYRSKFDHEFYSCRLGHAKPDSVYFERILEALRIRPERVLFFDDVERNVLSAQNLGIHAVHFGANAGAEVLSAYLAEFDVRGG